MRLRISIRGRVPPSVGLKSVGPVLLSNDEYGHFEGKNYSNDQIINDTMSDNEVVAPDVFPRFMFFLFLTFFSYEFFVSFEIYLEECFMSAKQYSNARHEHMNDCKKKKVMAVRFFFSYFASFDFLSSDYLRQWLNYCKTPWVHCIIWGMNHLKTNTFVSPPWKIYHSCLITNSFSYQHLLNQRIDSRCNDFLGKENNHFFPLLPVGIRKKHDACSFVSCLGTGLPEWQFVPFPILWLINVFLIKMSSLSRKCIEMFAYGISPFPPRSPSFNPCPSPSS